MGESETGRQQTHAQQQTPGQQDDEPAILAVGEGAARRAIVVRRRTGGGPGIVWLGGFMSDMGGTKAVALDAFAAAQKRSFVRFDYSGHGASQGLFVDGTISRWLEETLAVWDAFCRGPQVVVGSSMGGWLALLLARALRAGRRGRPAASLAAMVLIAPAVDFTEELIWNRLPPDARRELVAQGICHVPSRYEATGSYPITAQLLADGRSHLLLGGLIETGCPVRILQGIADPDVPFTHAVELVSRLAMDDVVLSLIKDGDHRLSRPEDLERLIAAVAEFAGDGAVREI